ncbi:AraC family transcriptional regulator [Microbacterium sp. NPDC055683]
MIAELNHLVELIEHDLGDEVDVARAARTAGTTEYHLRRMFSSLAGMPLSEYVRRRRMTAAASEVMAGDDDLLSVAIRFGYGSAEAFGRAFRAVHGIDASAARADGGPLRMQSPLRFRLTVEGSVPMDARIIDRPALRLAGHAARVPLIHRGANPHIQEFVTSLPPSAHTRLKELADSEPRGILQVTDDIDPAAEEGASLSYLHGVAVSERVVVPDDLDVIEVPAGAWAVFRSEGAHPDALQTMWAATAAEWFPSNPWRLRPGPSIVATLQHSADFRTATCELWLPVERA